MPKPDKAAAVEIRDTRAGNWWWAHNLVLDHYVGEGVITPGEALVYFALCRLSRDGRCEKGVPEIARLAGAKERFTRSAIGRLDELGLIAVERRRDERGQLPNAYAVLTPPALRTGGTARDDTTPLQPEQGLPASSAGLNKTVVKDAPEEDLSNGRATIRLEDGLTIRRFVDDLARELNDQAPPASSQARALNLFADSGLAIDVFAEMIYEARRRTQQHSGQIRSDVQNGRGKPKMPYFFAVLESLIETAAVEQPANPQRQRSA